MNRGLRDVASLVNMVKRKEPFRDLGDMTLLRRYERARRSDIQKLSFATDSLQRLFSWPGGLMRSVRNAGLTLFNQNSFLKRLLVAYAQGL